MVQKIALRVIFCTISLIPPRRKSQNIMLDKRKIACYINIMKWV